MNPLLDTIGRLHPMVLHMPIGLIMGLAAWELWRSWRGGGRLDAAAVFIAWLGVLTAGMAIGTGLLHERELGDADLTTVLHKWLGIAAGVGAALAALLATWARVSWRPRHAPNGEGRSGKRSRKKRAAAGSDASAAPGAGAANGSNSAGGVKGGRRGRRARPSHPVTTLYRVVLFITVGVLVPAGHFGADITHGPGFVLAPLMPSSELSASGTPDGSAPDGSAAGPGSPSGSTTGSSGTAGNPDALRAGAFEVLAARCESCHGPVRTRGGLRLTSLDEMLTGGRDGPAIVAGDPASSHIVQRMRLPLSDRDHMPPSSRPQPTVQEIEAVEAWIRSLGANATGLGTTPPNPSAAPSAGPSTTPASPDPTATPGSAPPPEDEPLPPAPDPAAIAVLRERLHHVQPIAEGSPLLWVDLSGEGVDDAIAEALLRPLVSNIAELSLARSGVTDDIAGLLAAMPRLTRLDLASTAVGDNGLARLAGHPRLRTIVLAGAGVTDGAMDALGSMALLRHLYLWDTAVTEDGLAWLLLLNPEVTVDTGDAGAEPLEQEPEIVLGPPAASGKPVNETCPVTGSSVDARYTRVFEGRTIGFCCPNCPGEFEADPAKFAGNLPAPE